MHDSNRIRSARPVTAGVLLSRGLVIPARRNHPPSLYPSIAIGLINPDCTGAETNDGRSFANANQPFEVAN
jgi:hypothetical protein